MVWVCLADEPAAPLPKVPELDDPAYRRIEVGVIGYDTSAAAVVDNNTDATHVAFVHAGSFGAGQDPRIAPSEVERTPFGIRISSPEMAVAETPAARSPGWRRSITEIWVPFVQVSRMTYSDGTTHILVKGCCPADDSRTEVHLSVLRNDLDDEADVSRIVAFELGVEAEDKAVLDTVRAGFPLDPRLQTHTRHDRPGIAYRNALRDLLSTST
jgi:phenylpropionate dioxygenase-like ring-hydroxylating dioxygenase large terminal subunit